MLWYFTRLYVNNMKAHEANIKVKDFVLVFST